MDEIDVPRGLKGVVVAETGIGDVRGLEGFYHYRQYSAVELATELSFEDAWFLMLESRLPDPHRTGGLRRRGRLHEGSPRAVRSVLPTIAAAASSSDAGPLDALRSAVSLLATVEGFRPSHDIAPAELPRTTRYALCAIAPTLVARSSPPGAWSGADSSPGDLGHAANYLYMISGDSPEQRFARSIEEYMTSTIDHGFNASTFTARVVTSTGADLGSAVVAALGALSGPLHGGAPSRALDTLDSIGSPGPGGALDPRSHRQRRQDHGVRPPGVQDLRSQVRDAS